MHGADLELATRSRPTLSDTWRHGRACQDEAAETVRRQLQTVKAAISRMVTITQIVVTVMKREKLFQPV